MEYLPGVVVGGCVVVVDPEVVVVVVEGDVVVLLVVVVVGTGSSLNRGYINKIGFIFSIDYFLKV